MNYISKELPGYSDEKLYAAHLAQAPTSGTASWANATPSSRDERAESVAYTVDELGRLSAWGRPGLWDAVRDAGMLIYLRRRCRDACW